jgi:hypothetical protein
VITVYISTTVKSVSMWKPLSHTNKVNPGDKVRFSDNNSFVHGITLYQVVKAESHYFEIGPSEEKPGLGASLNKIVRYFDLGYNIKLEIWVAA